MRDIKDAELLMARRKPHWPNHGIKFGDHEPRKNVLILLRCSAMSSLSRNRNGTPRTAATFNPRTGCILSFNCYFTRDTLSASLSAIGREKSERLQRISLILSLVDDRIVHQPIVWSIFHDNMKSRSDNC